MKKVIEYVNAFALLIMFLITIGQIVFRSILRISAAWSEELAQYTFAFIVFVGATTLTRDEGHITISVVADRLSAGWQRILRVGGRLAVLPFVILFSIGAFQNMQSTWTIGLPTAEWVRIGYMYLVLFASGVLIFFFLAFNTFLDLTGGCKPRATTTESTGGAA